MSVFFQHPAQVPAVMTYYSFDVSRDMRQRAVHHMHCWRDWLLDRGFACDEVIDQSSPRQLCITFAVTA